MEQDTDTISTRDSSRLDVAERDMRGVWQTVRFNDKGADMALKQARSGGGWWMLALWMLVYTSSIKVDY